MKLNLGYVSYNKDYRELYKYLQKNLKKNFNAKLIRKFFKEKYTFEIAEEKLLNIFNKEVK